ncbi:MAG: hypothetical protein GDA50_03940 [Alphaproteobacteria bacterium GM202ARS2]|nr:hypothetical protein [Alphaproteobacteria bacterium GM202ARS2]
MTTAKVCGWLASVRDADEAQRVLSTQASIIDIKEPTRGALGMASLDQLRAILAAVDAYPVTPRKFISVALGDYGYDEMTHAYENLRACGTLAGVDVVKVGLRLVSGERLPSTIDDSFRQWARHAYPKKWALVLFADDVGFATHWHTVVARASRQGCYACVIDTANKKSGDNLTTLLSMESLRALVTRVHGLGMGVIFAGSLREQDIGILSSFGVDYLGFRGLLCAGGRNGRIDEQSLQRVQACFHKRVRATAGAQLSTRAWSARV